MVFDVDLFVIGGGSGGIRAARMAAASGAKVALAEDNRLGGTCVIRGCVPKKLMVFASSFNTMPKQARAYGWDIMDGEFNWVAFRTKLHANLNRLEHVYHGLLKDSGVMLHDARARIVDSHRVELSNGVEISSRRILIATGGRPERPRIAGAEFGMVSDDVFQLEALPKSLLIVGGGFIACEMACLMNGLGVKVTQFYRGSQVLRGFDGEARALITKEMIGQGVNLRLGENTAQLEKAHKGSEIRVTSTAGNVESYEAVLFATGRRSNSKNIGLEEVNVTVGKKGEVVVDQYHQTSVPSIYAIGDVTNRVNLTPVAIHEGMTFVKSVYEGVVTPVDHALIPTAVFTQPELGAVGLTEEEARAQEPVDVYVTTFQPMRSFFAGESTQVMVKLIVSRATNQVLGCHIVAPEAGEMIQLAGIAIKMGATKEDFDRTIAVHPTISEELVTMRTPARCDLDGRKVAP